MENRIIAILSELVRIDSVSPTLSNGPGEIEIAEFVRQYLHQLQLDVEIQTVAPNRANVVAAIQGTSNKRSLLLNSHLDTVGVEDMKDPFILKRKGDKLYGRGTYDMKGSVALMLLLARHLVRHRPPADVYLTFVADEEDMSIGMEYIVEKWLPKISSLPIGAIFLEPTEQNIGVGHKVRFFCRFPSVQSSICCCASTFVVGGAIATRGTCIDEPLDSCHLSIYHRYGLLIVDLKGRLSCDPFATKGDISSLDIVPAPLLECLTIYLWLHQ